MTAATKAAPKPKAKSKAKAKDKVLTKWKSAMKKLSFKKKKAGMGAKKKQKQKKTTKPAAKAVKKKGAVVAKVVGAVKEAVAGKTKISASLGVLLAHLRSGTAMAMVKSGKGMAAGALRAAAAGRPASTGAPLVPLLVRVDPSSKLKELRGKGSVRTALVPESEIMTLAAHAEVKRLSAPRRRKPLMDVALPLVGVPAFRAAAATASSGKGVIIGVVDSGIDANHPAFAGRILKTWDHNIQGSGPGIDYTVGGQVLTGPQLTVSVDGDGHGTHVAGIAAGADATFSGVAPEADLLVVKTNFYDNSILEGVRWIFEEADRLGRPAVVNLSLGGHGDGHDGTDGLSTGIGELCGPGRLVVASAGNESGDDIHAEGVVTGATRLTVPVRVAPKSSNLPLEWFLLNGWYDGAGECEIRLKGPTGATTPWQGLQAGDADATTHQLGMDEVILASPDTAVGDGDRQFTVEVVGVQGRVQGGVWTLEVKRKSGTPGRVHVWLVYAGDVGASTLRFSQGVATDAYLVGSPGACAEAVTVAAYTSKNTWTDITGTPQSVGMPVNDISDFSSPGPLRDRRLKPDVTAPGAMIVSCESSAAIDPIDPHANDADRVAAGFVVNAGTSMSCPFITGVLALLLERKPNLSPDEAKAFLKQRSRIPGANAGVHHPKWGYGLLKL